MTDLNTKPEAAPAPAHIDPAKAPAPAAIEKAAPQSGEHQGPIVEPPKS